MREIKFRCWDNEFKKMYYDGFALRANSKANDLNILFESSHFKTGQYAPFDMEIMQFTGLCDSKGEEIYEGDIVERSKNHKLEKVVDIVTYMKGSFCIGTELLGFFGECKVIGNIHESYLFNS